MPPKAARPRRRYQLTNRKELGTTETKEPSQKVRETATQLFHTNVRRSGLEFPSIPQQGKINPERYLTATLNRRSGTTDGDMSRGMNQTIEFMETKGYELSVFNYAPDHSVESDSHSVRTSTHSSR